MAPWRAMSASDPPPVLDVPSIVAYTQGVRPAFAFILIAAIFSAMLLPLLVMLFTLSTPKSRRTPTFILNVISISLGILGGALTIHLTIESVLSPFTDADITEDFFFNILSAWIPWITESILLLRVLAIFRPKGFANIVKLLGVPVIIKAARAALNIIFLVQWKQIPNASRSEMQFQVDWVLQFSWILELVDNAIIACLFLWRLAFHSHAFSNNAFGRTNPRHSKTASLSSKLQTLFWIASTNFVFPLIFGLCQTILLYVPGKQSIAANIKMVNVYVSIVCTVLATIWASTTAYHPATFMQSHSDASRSAADRRQENALHGVVIEISTLSDGQTRKDDWLSQSGK